jgi:hypothetical protein
VIVLTNADDGNPLQYIMKAFDWVVSAVAKAAVPRPKKTKPTVDLSIYTGKYRNAWGDMQVLLLNGKLVAIDPSLPDPKVGEVVMTPVAEHTFRMEAKSNFSSDGEQAVFEMDNEGQVTRIKVGANYVYPVVEW